MSYPALGICGYNRKEGMLKKRLSSDVLGVLKYKAAQPELLKRASATFNCIVSCAVRAVIELSPKCTVLQLVALSVASPEQRLHLT